LLAIVTHGYYSGKLCLKLHKATTEAITCNCANQVSKDRKIENLNIVDLAVSFFEKLCYSNFVCG
jgi:phosphoribosylpyrophosphate synthetase